MFTDTFPFILFSSEYLHFIICSVYITGSTEAILSLSVSILFLLKGPVGPENLKIW